jgi:hypothetical protein
MQNRTLNVLIYFRNNPLLRFSTYIFYSCSFVRPLKFQNNVFSRMFLRGAGIVCRKIGAHKLA